MQFVIDYTYALTLLSHFYFLSKAVYMRNYMKNWFIYIF